MARAAESDGEAIDQQLAVIERVDQILGVAETKHSIRFKSSKRNELTVDELTSEQITKLRIYLGKEFAALNTQLIMNSKTSSATRIASKMHVDHGETGSKEVLIKLETTTTDNEYMDPQEIANHDPFESNNL